MPALVHRFLSTSLTYLSAVAIAALLTSVSAEARKVRRLADTPPWQNIPAEKFSYKSDIRWNKHTDRYEKEWWQRRVNNNEPGKTYICGYKFTPYDFFGRATVNIEHYNVYNITALGLMYSSSDLVATILVRFVDASLFASPESADRWCSQRSEGWNTWARNFTPAAMSGSQRRILIRSARAKAKRVQNAPSTR